MKNKIEFRKKDHDLFLLFWKQFEKKVDNLKDVVIENTGNNIILSYEIPPKAPKLTNKMIKLWLADAIVIYNKEKYIKAHFKTPILDNLAMDLMARALSVFDKASDVEYVYDKLKDLKVINVWSLYVFRLASIRFKWQEICDLFSRNLPNLLETDVFIEFMRYLLVVTESSLFEAYLFIEDGLLYIKDKKDNDLTDPVNILGPRGCIKALMELISLAPKNIIICSKINTSPELEECINNLFATKVVYCT